MEQRWEQWDEQNNHSGSGLVARLYKLKTWHPASFASIADILGVLEHGFVAQIFSTEDSPHESSVLAGVYEQLDTDDVQDPELVRV